MGKNLDMLPTLKNSYVLNSGQIEEYQKNGHACLRGLATSEEVEIYGEAIREVVKELNYQNKPIHERTTYGKAFIQIGNVWKKVKLFNASSWLADLQK